MELLYVAVLGFVLVVVAVVAEHWSKGKPVEKEPVKPEPVKPKRARTKSGHFKADDPSTPDVNEAWEGGKAPKKPKKKKTTRKKSVKRDSKKNK